MYSIISTSPMSTRAIASAYVHCISASPATPKKASSSSSRRLNLRWSRYLTTAHVSSTSTIPRRRPVTT